MSIVRFIGCLHFGHPSIARRRGFEEAFLHDEYLIDSWNKTVHKKDIVYILGDVTMETSKHYYQLDRLKGRKIVVMGNHDLHQHTKELLTYVDSVAGMVDYKGFCLTHAPIHPCEMGRYRGNIHAHIHSNLLEEVVVHDMYADEDSKLIPTVHKYHCVDAHRVQYIPQTVEQLIKKNGKEEDRISG